MFQNKIILQKWPKEINKYIFLKNVGESLVDRNILVQTKSHSMIFKFWFWWLAWQMEHSSWQPANWPGPGYEYSWENKLQRLRLNVHSEMAKFVLVSFPISFGLKSMLKVHFSPLYSFQSKG